MHNRWASVLAILIIVLCVDRSAAVLAQTNAQLDLTLIGSGGGPYYAPAGQTTQLKLQILNIGQSDVFLIEGEAYLDPNLSGNWQLVHSEDMGNFHLAKLESAIWTFELQMPPHVQALNITGGVPQVKLLTRIVYSTTPGKQQSAEGQFLLSVPGAETQRTDYSLYLIVLILAIVALAVILARKVKSGSIRKAQS